jgi:hypothetical protein
VEEYEGKWAGKEGIEAYVQRRVEAGKLRERLAGKDACGCRRVQLERRRRSVEICCQSKSRSNASSTFSKLDLSA